MEVKICLPMWFRLAFPYLYNGCRHVNHAVMIYYNIKKGTLSYKWYLLLLKVRSQLSTFVSDVIRGIINIVNLVRA